MKLLISIIAFLLYTSANAQYNKVVIEVVYLTDKSVRPIVIFDSPHSTSTLPVAEQLADTVVLRKKEYYSMVSFMAKEIKSLKIETNPNKAYFLFSFQFNNSALIHLYLNKEESFKYLGNLQKFSKNSLSNDRLISCLDKFRNMFQ